MATASAAFVQPVTADRIPGALACAADPAVHSTSDLTGLRQPRKPSPPTQAAKSCFNSDYAAAVQHAAEAADADRLAPGQGMLRMAGQPVIASDGAGTGCACSRRAAPAPPGAADTAITLADLLHDVHRWTGCFCHFTHLVHGELPEGERRQMLLARGDGARHEPRSRPAGALDAVQLPPPVPNRETNQRSNRQAAYPDRRQCCPRPRPGEAVPFRKKTRDRNGLSSGASYGKLPREEPTTGKCRA
jgi:hypothetical protein